MSVSRQWSGVDEQCMGRAFCQGELGQCLPDSWTALFYSAAPRYFLCGLCIS